MNHHSIRSALAQRLRHSSSKTHHNLRGNHRLLSTRRSAVPSTEVIHGTTTTGRSDDPFRFGKMAAAAFAAAVVGIGYYTWHHSPFGHKDRLSQQPLIVSATPSSTPANNNKSNRHHRRSNVDGGNHDKKDTNKKFRVLVVGSGLTGCLTALRIRQRLQHHPSMSSTTTPKNDANNTDVEIHIVERANYPSGRFGAVAKLPDAPHDTTTATTASATAVANLGAQVLSTVNPSDARSRHGGHGITPQDVDLAYEIVTQHLSARDLVRLVPNDVLGETCERMIWQDLWLHYRPTGVMGGGGGGGMSGLLRALLEDARVCSCRFGVRIDSVVGVVGGASGCDHGDQHRPSSQSFPSMIRVRGVSRPPRFSQPLPPMPPPSYLPPSSKQNTTTAARRTTTETTNTPTPTASAFQEYYHCVVLCLPAPEAVKIIDSNNNNTNDDDDDDATIMKEKIMFSDSSSSWRVLRNVGYDSRTCEAHFYDGSLVPYLDQYVFRSSLPSPLDDDDDDDDDEKEDSEETTKERKIIELNVEHLGTDIEYVSWQDRYDHLPEQDKAPQNSTTTTLLAPTPTATTLVVHGLPTNDGKKLHSLESSLDHILAKLIPPLDVAQISSQRIHSKSIRWETSQMIAPMEAVIADPPLLVSASASLELKQNPEGGGGGERWQCLTSEDKSLIVAGDFMTQSSFLGCVGSADAAARAVLERIVSLKEHYQLGEGGEGGEGGEEENLDEIAYMLRDTPSKT